MKGVQRCRPRSRLELKGRNAVPLPFPSFASLCLPRLDDERLCDFLLQVQKEMSKTLL